MSDPDSFPTLQSIVLHEVQNDVALVRNSATEALLWLRRGLRFLKEFLSEVNAGQQDIQGALSKHVDTKTSPVSLDKHQALCGFLRADNAYGKTLRQYHGWVVRGVFAVGVSLSHLTTFALQHCGNDSFVPCDYVFPAGPESSSILSKFQRRPGVERGRWAEERLHQRDAPGSGGLPARHGAAAGHPGPAVRRVQPGVRRSGVKTWRSRVSLPVEADCGGRTATGCCCQVPSRASCVQKSAIVSCATSRGWWKPMPV